ncbi:MAG: hypothetical protein IID40_11940 [Planctomycetes bacterium]|nr:hypothetical protein [Planctomycetota bacterium]
MAVSDRIMFEIYREASYAQRYRVVYFTELDEHNKEAEISRAMAGDHLFDGFIGDRDSRQAKQVIADILDRLNQGEDLGSEAVGALLAPIMAD